ncbi:NADH-quinone oxidoreductase subunit N [Halorhabdus sp. CBA1104]|uniref:NADH-quinone oxidoreductase subunit N n=1 Tax=Halorhabdus sp. CBA1104 TaxID=1380432 RepID=UPI0012B41485|nr:NADH-quinone oxidoreductase subunit N [Halorhabdus sp. CBA1104]QGN07534.1 NADH-quinone oxidoreductase subunit N [Halorhabdus sp. CBA1104]
MAAIELPTWAALAPALVLAVTALVLFLIDSIEPEPDTTSPVLLTAVGLVGALSALAFNVWYLLAGTGQSPAIELFGGQLMVDGMTLVLGTIVASVLALVVLGSYDYIRDEPHQAEYFSLLFLAATGMTLLGAVDSFATAFLALELSSLPSYALVAYLKDNRGSVEAGLKYFLIGALSSAIFAYGISLIYGATGSLQFDAVAAAVDPTALPGVLGVGIVMVTGGVAFKTASVPFHFWAPEAYEGAPTPISAFISSASKAAGFILAFRIFTTAFPIEAVAATIDWLVLFQALAVVTMVLGNFAAATQESVKRMLAYSSIGHAGYVLIALAALTPTANADLVLGAGMLHLLVYGFMNTGAFLFVGLAEYWDVGRTFEDYNGLATEAPVASVAMTIFLFSLAGLPVGAGFLSKYVLFGAAVGAGLWWLAAVGAIASALSLFYYARVVKALWIEEPSQDFEIDSYPLGLYVAIIVAAVVTVLLLPAFGFASEEAIAAAGALL